MIYFFYGQDRQKTREKATALKDSLLKRKPNASFYKIESDNWNEAELDNFIEGKGLFEAKYIVLFDHVFENDEAKERIISKLDEISSSEHIFIFIEQKLDKDSLKLIEKKSEKIQESEKDEVVKKEFNIFGLSDALGKRDKKNLWMLYLQAMKNGSVPEEIHGTLFWQVKSMNLAAAADSAAASGLKPFVYSKAKGFSKNYSEKELRNLSSKLVEIYHEAHRGAYELQSALEQFILSL